MAMQLAMAGEGVREHGVCGADVMDPEQHHPRQHPVRSADGQEEVRGGHPRLLPPEGPRDDGVRRPDRDRRARHQPQRRPEAAHPARPSSLPGRRYLPPRRRLQRRRCANRLRDLQGASFLPYRFVSVRRLTRCLLFCLNGWVVAGMCQGRPQIQDYCARNTPSGLLA